MSNVYLAYHNTKKNKVENIGDGITKGAHISKTHHFQATTSITTSTIVIKGNFIYIIKKMSFSANLSYL